MEAINKKADPKKGREFWKYRKDYLGYKNEFISPYPEYCSHFGCGRKLGITEKLYGKRCFAHSLEPPEIINTHLINKVL